ncbi:MAG TPA: 16S rRNA (cytosine(1402)-N(4))-methyltransferase RsmH [Gammaproteobacteria bacterium]|nr:16S rRNA (cytosine(1402)-N(4))-methyltransferase RsmH [Gammaproteobacteria bacterium]
MSQSSGFSHRPVLLAETLAGLAIQPDGVYLDGTFGRGGHAQAVLQQLGPNGRLLAIDKDPAAIACAEKLHEKDSRVTVWRGAFTMLERIAQQENLAGHVNGVLLDLGVSSPQLDDAARGFSFQNDGPLDMRMDPDSGISVADWLAQAPQETIARVLRELGEERFAGRIARHIVETRQSRPLTRTHELAELIAKAVPTRERGKHPATRSFQALRIFINKELDELPLALEQAVSVLAPKGRLCVISFHSLEDRLVKRFMRDKVRPPNDLPELPYAAPGAAPQLRLIGKAMRASDTETRENPRARSAVLRVAEKL